MSNFKVGNTNFLGVDTSFVNMERSIEVALSLRRVFWHMQGNRKNDMRKTMKLMGRSKIIVDENFLHFFVRFLLPPKCQVLVTMAMAAVMTSNGGSNDDNGGNDNDETTTPTSTAF